MDDWVLGMALGILFLITGTLLLRLELCHKSLIFHLKGANAELNSTLKGKDLEISDDLFSELSATIESTVTDLLGTMKTPTAIDHLAGVAANIMQMREQWKIQKEANDMNMTNNLMPPQESHGTS